MAANAKRTGQPVQTPQAIHDCHALLLWIIPQLDKFPRLRRYTLGERIETLLLQVLERLLSASPSDIGVGIPKGPVNFGYHRDHVFSFLSGVIFSPVGSSALAAVRAAGQASVEALEGARMTVPEARSVSKS